MMYTGASCGTWISPRNRYVAHGARSLAPGNSGCSQRGAVCACALSTWLRSRGPDWSIVRIYPRFLRLIGRFARADAAVRARWGQAAS
eukprot:846970-Prorocentrum_minimum.AAC.1